MERIPEIVLKPRGREKGSGIADATRRGEFTFGFWGGRAQKRGVKTTTFLIIIIITIG